VEFNVEGASRRVESLIETVLFRIAQESLTNIARHAQTEGACICLNYLDDEITLSISDAGIGFVPGESPGNPRGWGLAGMKERAESVGGRLQVESRPEGGTTVEARIPLIPAQEEPNGNNPPDARG
jgi:signal transduction histidine kinase